MCGIVSIFSGRQIDEHLDLQKAVECLRHRGPDEISTWISPDKKIALGHTRLNVMDPKHAHQPLHVDNVHAVINGEFYDFERIRQDLEKDGARFITKGDSEILLHLYRRYGIGAVEALRGEFSFVLWDNDSCRVLAGRDRFGIKPLYYCEYGDQLIFASEAKAIKALGVPMSWDEENIYNLSAGFVMDPRRSLFANIFQLPPGHIMIASAAERRIQEYWNFDHRDTFSQPDCDDHQTIELFRKAFEEAVRLRLRSDVPVACYLSGGIDSCGLLGAAIRIRSRPIKAFSVSFDNPLYDERPFAEEMAKISGADLEVVTVTEQDLADNFENAVQHSEYTFANAHGIAKFILSRFVRQSGYKVVLTGEGADEILAGYPHFRQDLIVHAYSGAEQVALMQALAAQNAASQGLVVDISKDKIPFLENLIGMTPSFLQAHINAAKRGSAILSEDFSDKFSSTDAFERVLGPIDMRPIRNAHPVDKSLYLWNKTTFPSYLLNVLGDRMEMAHSIEGRLPFLDHPLVELAQRLPISKKIRNLNEKWILREAVKSYVPQSVYKKHKHPFTAPPSTINPHGPLFTFIRDTLASRYAKELSFFDTLRICKMLDHIDRIPPPELGNADVIVSMLTSLVLLKKQFAL